MTYAVIVIYIFVTGGISLRESLSDLASDGTLRKLMGEREHRYPWPHVLVLTFLLTPTGD